MCSFDESTLNTSMGEIIVKDTELGESEVDNDMGSIQIEGCTFQNLSADNAMGDTSINVNQNLDNFGIELETEMGRCVSMTRMRGRSTVSQVMPESSKPARQHGKHKTSLSNKVAARKDKE